MNTEEKKREAENMNRVHRIFTHPLYKDCLKKNEEAEKERVFCGHDMPHFLDVARLAYLFSLERGYGVPKEEIYAAALLHDIGRWRQYCDGTPHDKASAELAEGILESCGFSKREQSRILTAILSHRGKENAVKEAATKEAGHLAEILYDADKLSRPCYGCGAIKECDWEKEKKNLQILW